MKQLRPVQVAGVPGAWYDDHLARAGEPRGQVSGLGIQLPDWKYVVVCDLSSGQLQYDNYEGRWGDQEHLDRFLQRYAVEKCRIESRKQGHCLTERYLQRCKKAARPQVLERFAARDASGVFRRKMLTPALQKGG